MKSWMVGSAAGEIVGFTNGTDDAERSSVARLFTPTYSVTSSP
ncbi:MAG TPA: hypothetical protein VG797_02315 [Phycisphaerales bacterium]|nr:hypothetical protein [Phycisphaerales bacterium]